MLLSKPPQLSTGPVPARRRARRLDKLPTIGWREWLAVPTLGIPSIKAKIDTGARTSSLHAFNIRAFVERGAPHVAFVIHPLQRRRKPSVDCIARIHDERVVTSSSGHRELRYVIRADIALGEDTWPIELTLADRDTMGFRMLLGRQALRGRFLVDPGRSFIAGRDRAGAPTKPKRKTRDQ